MMTDNVRSRLLFILYDFISTLFLRLNHVKLKDTNVWCVSEGVQTSAVHRLASTQLSIYRCSSDMTKRHTSLQLVKRYMKTAGSKHLPQKHVSMFGSDGTVWKELGGTMENLDSLVTQHFVCLPACLSKCRCDAVVGL